jgi:hypothetical protein
VHELADRALPRAGPLVDGHAIAGDMPAGQHRFTNRMQQLRRPNLTRVIGNREDTLLLMPGTP